MLCEQMGYRTGVDMPRLLEVVDLISDMLGRPRAVGALEWLRNAMLPRTGVTPMYGTAAMTQKGRDRA
jgi:hypothetical protein